MFAFFDAIDSLCQPLPAFVRLCLYGLVMGLLGMLIYWRTSPQKQIIAVRERMAEAQKALRAYKGTDGKVILQLSANTIAPAVKQILLVIGPTVIAMAPVLLMVAWLEETYSYRLPAPGDVVAVHSSAPVAFNPPTAARATGIAWPAANETIEINQASDGRPLLHLPIARAVTNVDKPHWWSAILAGRNRIELPADAAVSSIQFVFPAREVMGFGPGWLRSWYTPFMLALSVAALVMKFTVKIV